MIDRYNRHIILTEIGLEGQEKLLAAKVLVIGAGGLGCPVLQYLAAVGIGTIGIIDFDSVELSNLQRQVLYGKSSLGKNKAIAAKERLEDLNDDIIINAYPEALTYRNALSLFEKYDIIVDGSDNFETRYLVNDACLITKKPLVFGAIFKFEGQVSVFNYDRGPSYRCLFPKAPKKNTIPNCSEVGVLGVLPGIIGSMQANEVIKIVTGIGEVLSGKLLCYNTLSNQNNILQINRNQDIINQVLNNKLNFESQLLNLNCQAVNMVSIRSIRDTKDIQFIDVRELHEEPRIESVEVIAIPFSELEKHVALLITSTPKYVFCQSGVRSKKAVNYLTSHGITNCFSLEEGATEIDSFLKSDASLLIQINKETK